MSSIDLKRKKDLSKVIAVSLGVSVVFLVSIQLLSRFIADHPSDTSIRWLAAFPVVALSAGVGLAMRSLRRMDELERKMHTEAMAFAFMVSIPLITTYEFLALAGFLTATVLSGWLAPAMVACWVVGLLRAAERYR